MMVEVPDQGSEGWARLGHNNSMRLGTPGEQLPPCEALPGIEDGQVVYHNGEGYYYICEEFDVYFKERLFKCVKRDCGATAKMGPMNDGFPLLDLESHSHPADVNYRQKCILLHSIRRKFIKEDGPAFTILKSFLKSCLTGSNNQTINSEDMQVSTNHSEEQLFMDCLGEENACIASVPQVVDNSTTLPTEVEEPRLKVQPVSQTYKRKNTRRAIILNVENTEHLLDYSIDFSNQSDVNISTIETFDHKMEAVNSSVLKSEQASPTGSSTDVESSHTDPCQSFVPCGEDISETVKQEPPDQVEFVDVNTDMIEEKYVPEEDNCDSQESMQGCSSSSENMSGEETEHSRQTLGLKVRTDLTANKTKHKTIILNPSSPLQTTSGGLFKETNSKAEDLIREGMDLKPKSFKERICKCPFNCGKFNEKNMQELLSNFKEKDYNGQTLHLAESCVQIGKINRHRVEELVSKRHCTVKYYLKENGFPLRVCRRFLCHVYQITPRRVQMLIEKLKFNRPLSDRRGTHANRPGRIPNST